MGCEIVTQTRMISIDITRHNFKKRNEMIVLEFTKSKSIVARLIRLFTWSPYSHVAVVAPDGRRIEAVEFQGVIDSRRYRHERVDVYTMELPYELERKFFNAVESQIGKPYDYGAILGFLGRQNWQAPNKWFCSELIAWGFQKIGRQVVNTKNAWRVTPRDLALSTRLRKQ